MFYVGGRAVSAAAGQALKICHWPAASLASQPLLACAGDFAKLKTSPLGVAVHYNDDVLCVAAAAAAAAAGSASHCALCVRRVTTTVHTVSDTRNAHTPSRPAMQPSACYIAQYASSAAFLDELR